MWSGAEDSLPATISAYTFFIVGTGALIWRRRHPVLVHWIVLTVAVVCLILSYSDSPIFAVAISTYSIGRYCRDDTQSYLGVSAAIVLIATDHFIDNGTLSQIGFVVLLAFADWYIGRRIRARGHYIELLQERARYVEQRQVAKANKAVAEERSRIARELHDIIAHQVSVMTVQAGAAKTIAAIEPATAVKAMSHVENAGRKALGELRHLLNVLRPKDDTNTLTPQPSLKDISQLVADFEQAGPKVTLSIETVKTDVPARIGLTIYRIVQEALTNVLKHAGQSSRAEVNITIDYQNVTIEVVDNGCLPATASETGQGILGMRERAQQLGGSLVAAPRLNGGFQILAKLPLSGVYS